MAADAKPSRYPEPQIISPVGLEQIIIFDKIADWQLTGDIINPVYTNYFNTTKAFDNKIDLDDSYWSQYGLSGFSATLKESIDDYALCYTELYLKEPNGSQYMIDMDASTNHTGIADQPIEKLQLPR